jgi:MSHA pilin protein MshA
MKREKGFTLIELVTVIIILGILAAFAIPRFINLSTEARAASIEGLGGSVKAAAALAHSKAVANGEANLSGDITMEGAVVTLVNGFPNATTTNGIGQALQSMSGYTATGGGTAAGDTLTFTTDPAPTDSSQCQVAYTAPDKNGSATTDITTVDCG